MRPKNGKEVVEIKQECTGSRCGDVSGGDPHPSICLVDLAGKEAWKFWSLPHLPG